MASGEKPPANPPPARPSSAGDDPRPRTAVPTPPPFQHCALVPAAELPRLAGLHALSRLRVHALTARPVAVTAPATSPAAQAGPAGSAAPVETALPPPADPTASRRGDPADALAFFWSDDRPLEAALAALPGVQFFDWVDERYRERRAATPAGSDLAAEDALPGPAGPPRLPHPLRLEFAGLRALVDCVPGPALPLGSLLRLPQVRSIRNSGGYSIGSSGGSGGAPVGAGVGRGTPSRGVSFARPTASLPTAAGSPLPG
ncbi:MAG: hypothetical protein ACREJ2_13995, partial [Planctomycetota bacterium]